MKGRRKLQAALVAALLMTALGCTAFSERQIEEDFSPSVAGRLALRSEVRLGIGPAALLPARMLAVFWPRAREWRAAMRGVRKVEVGVFKIGVSRPGPADERWASLGRRLTERGWELLTRVQEPDRRTWVFYRISRGSIRQMYVISLDLHERELVLVKIHGRLERTLQAVLGRTGTLKR